MAADWLRTKVAPTRQRAWLRRFAVPLRLAVTLLVVLLLIAVPLPRYGFCEELASIRKLDGGSYVFALAFSPDGRMLAAAGEKGVRLWEAASGKLVHDLVGGQRVAGISVSPDGTLLAAGEYCEPPTRDTSYFGRLSLWETASGKLQERLRQESPIEAVAFSPDGEIVAFGDHDGGVGLWGVAGNRIVRLQHDDRVSITSVAFSPDGRTLAAGSDPPEPDIVPLQAADGTFIPHERPVGEDGTILVWNLATRKPALALSDASSEGVETIAFSPDGTMLASSHEDGKIRFWDAGTGKLLRSLPGHAPPSSPLCVAFSPDGKLLASGAYSEPAVCLWDVAVGAQLLRVDAHRVRVTALAFSPDGKLLATADSVGLAGCVHLWRLTGRNNR